MGLLWWQFAMRLMNKNHSSWQSILAIEGYISTSYANEKVVQKSRIDTSCAYIVTGQADRVCPAGHYCDYYIGTRSVSHVTATYLKIGCEKSSYTRTRPPKEFQWLDMDERVPG